MKSCFKKIVSTSMFILFLVAFSFAQQTTIYCYKNPKTNIYYFQANDITYGENIVNDAFKKYKLSVVLEHELLTNTEPKDRPRIKNGCELYRLVIYKNEHGEVVLEENKMI